MWLGFRGNMANSCFGTACPRSDESPAGIRAETSAGVPPGVIGTVALEANLEHLFFVSTMMEVLVLLLVLYMQKDSTTKQSKSLEY
jgi:hypothetical protein